MNPRTIVLKEINYYLMAGPARPLLSEEALAVTGDKTQPIVT